MFLHLQPHGAGASSGKSSAGLWDLHLHIHLPTGRPECLSAEPESRGAGGDLNYFPQTTSKMFNWSKSILITTRWISDGNLLSFLPACPTSCIPRQPCQKLPSPGKLTRHTAKEVPLTLASRFSCSPIPQTLRLLCRPPGKLLVAQGIHSPVGELPERWNY